MGVGMILLVAHYFSHASLFFSMDLIDGGLYIDLHINGCLRSTTISTTALSLKNNALLVMMSNTPRPANSSNTATTTTTAKFTAD